MPISGTDLAITPARAGILRSGAGRSGWPVLAGVRVPLYALAGVMRSGATRSNYHSPKAFVALNGVQYATARAVDAERILDGLTIVDQNGHEPSRATFRARGFTVVAGMDVVITLGSTHNLDRLFGGTVLPTAQTFIGTPANRVFSVSCIDYTWGLQGNPVTGRWYTTVAAIAAELIATYAPGYTVDVQAGFDDLDEFTATNEELPSVLTRLCKRGHPDGDWTCDYHKVVRCYVGADTSGTAPTILNTVQPITAQGGHALDAFTVTRDPSPWITRAYVEGGGANALTAVVAGETILPVGDAAWYEDDGGTVKSGPQGPRHLTYTGRDLGGGGGLVGPGASPTSAPAAALASGAGVTDGTHLIAITFVTAAGESLPGPTVPITVGVVAAPASAPTAGTPTIGTGPNPGSHNYATTNVTASGETTASPLLTKATTVTDAPSTAPTPGTPTTAVGVDLGTHDYATTNVTAIGETTPSPISGTVNVTGANAPTAIGTLSNLGSGPFVTHPAAGSNCKFKYTFKRTSDGAETTPGPATNASLGDGFIMLIPLASVDTPPAGYSRQWYLSEDNGVTYQAWGSETASGGNFQFGTNGSLGAAPPTTNGTLTGSIPLTIPVPTDPNVTSKRLWRRSGGAGLKLVTSLAVATTTYTDTTPNASLGAAVPGTNTAYLQRIPLTLTPPTNPLVTSVNIWGTAAGGSQLKLIANVPVATTSYTVTTTDAGLGANVPTVNTATGNQIALAGIAIGAAGVTDRKVYMTPISSTQLKLVTTIANNTADTYTITMADGSLGANVPITDGSGLAQPTGQVLAGSTSLIVAGTGAFRSTGGWAVIGNGTEVIRYTGKTGAALTGIPASGAGAIVASISYNSNVTAAPCLTGIPASGDGSVRFTILKGDPVNLWVQVDDVPGQAAYAAAFGGTGVKAVVLTDRRVSVTEATAMGTAYLAQHGAEAVTVSYLVRDQNTRAGRQVPINLGAPTSVVETLTIQTVTITNFTPARHPNFSAVASATRASFDDVVRSTQQPTQGG